MDETTIPLDLNESYWLLDDQTLSLIRDIPRTFLGTYPSYDELTASIATYAAVAPGNVCVTPGSDEAIRATMRYCAKRKYRALLILPTFSGYEKVLMETPLETTRLYYIEKDGRFEFPLEETLSCIKEHKVDVVFLCEPNNPLGTVLGTVAFTSIVDAAREANILIVSDEAYGEYGGSSAVPYIERQPVIVLRTLSKAFGVPGIRVGYAIASNDIAKELISGLFGTLPWIISGPSGHAALVVLSRAKELALRRDMVIKERDAFATDLAKLSGMHVYASCGNFILARHERASAIAAALLSSNIRVGEGERKTWDKTARDVLRATLRMAVPAPEHRERVLDAIHSAL